MEAILGTQFMNREEVIRFRKGINAHKPQYWTVLKGIGLGSSTMADFIQQRMVSGNTKYPNMRGATLLYQYLTDV